ncbi:MAG: hypothetical protein MRY78_17810, partial [Saprospiraceae bacterium]|nr:hypothetical protein [Saprospiraceae bacterium]
MRKFLLFTVLQLFALGAFAQCVDFENETPNPGPNYPNPPSNWSTIDCNYDFRQETGGNIYLEVRDGSGASYIYNNVDFTGDLSAQNCQSLCYDANYLNPGNGANAGTYRNSIFIYSGGTTPQSAPLCARFILNTPVNAGSGWNTFCPPLDFCTGTLPFDGVGYWEWVNSTNFNNTGSTCTDWSNLITNVTGIAFYIDRGGSPSEIWGLDNFCLTDTTCYNDKMFSTCFYTDFTDPTANDYNEYGYAGLQKQDGSFFVFGETQNRGIFGPGNVTDDDFLRANIDQLGVVTPINDYIHTYDPANIRYNDHFLLQMNPPFSTVSSSTIAFSNYHETGTPNHDIQITFLEPDDICIERTLDWTTSPNSSEFVRDVIQASNGDVVILGECYDNASSNIRRPFLYGMDLAENDFGNQKLNLFGQGLADVSVKAITEFTDGSGSRRYAITGGVDDRVLLFFTADDQLNLSGTYELYDIDNDPNTTEEAIDIAFSPQDNSFIITGTIYQPGSSNPGGPITLPSQYLFITKLDLNGFVQWTQIVNLSGGDETVHQLHLNDQQEITLTGNCKFPQLIAGNLRNDVSYLLKADQSGNIRWAYTYENAEGNQVNDLTYCTDQGYLLTGSCWTNYEDPNGGPFLSYLQNHDVWVVKTDSVGQLGPNADVCVEPIGFSVNFVDYSSEIRDMNGDEIIFEGIDYPNYECTPYVHEQEICAQYCPPPPNDTCDVFSTHTETVTDSCCVISLDLMNNMTTMHQIEVRILNPPSSPTTSTYFDVFNTITPYTVTQLSPTQLLIEDPTGAPIPSGVLNDYLEFCLADSTNTAPSQTIRIFYKNIFGLSFSGCFDDITIECPIEQEEPCYELVVDTLICNELPGIYDLCFTVTNNDILDSLEFVNFTSSDVIFFPNQVQFTPPIAPGASGPQVCVQIWDNSGLPLPRQISFSHDAHDKAYEYCCLGDSIDITLPNCCEPCVPDWVMVSPDSLGADSCCFALDFNIDCPLSLTELQVQSITPGVTINNVVLGGPGAANWTLSSNSTSATLNPAGMPTAAVGFYDDLLSFCLDDSLGIGLQEVIVSYIGSNGLGGDSILCQDTLQFNCEIDTDCIEIVQDSVYCDDQGNYFLDFCVTNVSNPPFSANELVIDYTSASGLI